MESKYIIAGVGVLVLVVAIAMNVSYTGKATVQIGKLTCVDGWPQSIKETGLNGDNTYDAKCPQERPYCHDRKATQEGKAMCCRFRSGKEGAYVYSGCLPVEVDIHMKG